MSEFLSALQTAWFLGEVAVGDLARVVAKAGPTRRRGGLALQDWQGACLYLVRRHRLARIHPMDARRGSAT